MEHARHAERRRHQDQSDDRRHQVREAQVATVWTLGTLLIAAFGAGRLILRATGERQDDLESRALAASAGLGAVALLLATLGLAGHLSWARWLVPAGALISLALQARHFIAWQPTGRPSPDAAGALAIAMLTVAAIGATAPVTEFDSLCYPVPITRHLVQDDGWRFWPDQVRSAFPLSQEFLTAPLMSAGSRALGLLSAAELALAACLIFALARRVTRHQRAPWIAVLITLGCPAVAFLAASAKEDLLVLVMTTAAAVSLVSARPGAAARVGLFAGFAAGAKLTGVPVAIAIVAAVPFTCGRTRRARDLATAAGVALLSGGLWFVVNVVRFGNPLPLLSLGPWFSPPLISPDVMAEWANGFGTGRGLLDALLAPWRMAIGSEFFGGRGNWINPLAFPGVAALFLRGISREARILIVIGVVGYVAWFSQIQVARLLLPSLALLSVPAAEWLASLQDRSRAARSAIAVALALSAGIVIGVGVIRLQRYAMEPAGYLARETPHYDDLVWMNTHLDPARDRVASSFEANGYLSIRWLTLNGTYQIVIRPEEMDDASRLRTALAREGVTYLFGPPGAFRDLADSIELVYENPASRIGGSSFFRAPRTEHTAVYRLTR